MGKVKKIVESVHLDKHYVIGVIFTLLALLLLIVHHSWQSKSLELVEKKSKFDLPDFASIKDIQQKKQQFFDYLRPLVEKENVKLKYQRALLGRLIADLENDPYHQGMAARKLAKLANGFDLAPQSVQTNINELLSRVDIIPASLVLAQAANESAWGTSRFAVQANNLFGQWCYKKGCGLVPRKRSFNDQHEVKKYASVGEAIASYMHNLNSNKAYQSLRNIRANLRLRGQRITGVSLARGLANYSERGEGYVNELIKLIKQNKLE